MRTFCVLQSNTKCHNLVFFVSDQQLEGADSRKRSVEAGLIETVLKLVDSPEPIQVQDLFQFVLLVFQGVICWQVSVFVQYSC